MLKLNKAAMCGIIALTCFLLILPSLAVAQTRLTFEVATIKPAEPITPQSIAAGKFHLGMNIDAARVDIGYLSLADLIPIAYKFKPYQFAGQDWMKTQRWDILATIPEGATKEQVPDMLKALLEDRFGLKAHIEQRENSVYALVVGKDGHKLKEAAPDPEKPAEPGPNTLTLGRGENQIRVNQERGGATIDVGQRGQMRVTPGQDGQMHMEMSKATMAEFVEMLTPMLDHPVVDMTGLKGSYQVAFDLSMETMLNMARRQGVGVPQLPPRGGGPGGAADASDPGSSSILTSVQQLGLKLESRKAPVDVVVVDRLEKAPTEN
jgi:uncharacterized protein (TIGR03435 family)